MFQTEKCCDFLILDKVPHSGTKVIDQIVNKNKFGIEFSSDLTETGKGFALKWVCAEANVVEPVSGMVLEYF